MYDIRIKTTRNDVSESEKVYDYTIKIRIQMKNTQL